MTPKEPVTAEALTDKQALAWWQALPDNQPNEEQPDAAE
jgi:hypothetical protein